MVTSFYHGEKNHYGFFYSSVQLDFTINRLKSVVLLEQIKTIDKRRVLSYIGRVSREEMRAIDDALQVSLDIHIPEEMEAP